MVRERITKPLSRAADLAIHPGAYVREQGLKPRNMSVTAFADAMGMSRPAVSNFLNGKAAASSEVASRVERVFGISASTVLDMQASYDSAQAKKSGAGASAIVFVPSFLQIKANQIEEWSRSTLSARARLAVLLRTLVHSTGASLTAVDFPGNDDAERPGWDGRVDALEGNPWIPRGQSGWEFGVSENPKGKADGDFAKSVRAISEVERLAMTFVFVTPRRWPGKDAWVADARASRQWFDVRAYDSSDLEQWLEQSLPGQAWLASELDLPAQGVVSLDRCWDDWSGVANPPLSKLLFGPSIEAARRIFSARLSASPERPIVVAADSVEEGKAFLARVFSDDGGPDLAELRDRVIVFDQPGVLPKLAKGALSFIPVAFTRAVEREFGPLSRTHHCVVVSPRNATNAEPDFTLEPVDIETFEKGLTAMGMDRSHVAQQARQSGRSLTVLRRHLSNVPAVRTPDWATVRETAEALIPMMFVGAWNSENTTDREGLSLLASRPYEELERECQLLTQLNDVPVWSIAHFRGVVSKIDLLYAIASSVTRIDLERYFDLAQLVLEEDDPTLDLDEDERWFGALRGKVRQFSSAFRRGVSETLVLLAVHGDQLFKSRLGFDCSMNARMTIRKLLPTPLNTRVLEANDGDLPTYAEASPQEFLSIIEMDLQKPTPAVLGLLKPAGSAPFAGPSRTGLLWALEGLAWNPETLARTALILARLAKVEIADNWVNKPINSLDAIFRAWMPQTAANHDERLAVMKAIAKAFPEIAWRLCVHQFSVGHEIGHYNHKPRWRADGFGFGEPFSTRDPTIKFQREMVEMALAWAPQSLATLSDLVECIHELPDGDQVRIWSLVQAWAAAAADDEKAALREKVRVSTFSYVALKRAERRGRKSSVSREAKAALDLLEPKGLLNRHRWLFKKHWMDSSFDDLHGDEASDFHVREKLTEERRSVALREVLATHGVAGFLDLGASGEAGAQIGWLSARGVIPEERLLELIQVALARIRADGLDAQSARTLIGGALGAMEAPERERVIRAAFGAEGDLGRAELLELAPFEKATWSLVDELGDEARASYWRSVIPAWLRDEAESSEAVTRLVAARRPRAAFVSIQHHPERVADRLLFEMLDSIAKGGGEDRDGEYRLDHYHLQEVFKLIDKSSLFTLDQKAALEFAYFEALTGPGKGHAIPNLERHVELYPDFFVRALVWTYKRRHGGEDPSEFKVPDERRSDMANRGWSLLQHIARIPGHNDLGVLEKDRLAKWVDAVRTAAANLDRTEAADGAIGKLLSHSLSGEDSVWPCEVVRDVMEDVASDEMMSGAQVGRYNSRGAHFRGEGGGEERTIANKYRKWAESLQFTHPFVSSRLLMGLASMYEQDANREDTEAGIRRRLH